MAALPMFQALACNRLAVNVLGLRIALKRFDALS
jgi:hypothetical protein